VWQPKGSRYERMGFTKTLQTFQRKDWTLIHSTAATITTINNIRQSSGLAFFPAQPLKYAEILQRCHIPFYFGTGCYLF
jgi:hypothetical protein